MDLGEVRRSENSAFQRLPAGSCRKNIIKTWHRWHIRPLAADISRVIHRESAVESLLLISLPIVLTVVVAGVIRAAAGAERGARLASIAVAGGFIASWGFLLTPGWLPVDSFARVGHITGGAALTGMVLDFISPKRFWAAAAAGVVILVSIWANLNDGFAWNQAVSAAMGASFFVIAAGALFAVACFDRMREQRTVAFVTIVMVALALATQAVIVGDGDLAATALMLALAVGAYAVFQVVVPLMLGDSIVLGVGAALLAVAWAMVDRDPSARIGLVLVPLILFADGTAKHIPLPAARISVVLYPLVLAGVAALPLILGALITFVVYGP